MGLRFGLALEGPEGLWFQGSEVSRPESPNSFTYYRLSGEKVLLLFSTRSSLFDSSLCSFRCVLFYLTSFRGESSQGLKTVVLLSSPKMIFSFGPHWTKGSIPGWRSVGLVWSGFWGSDFKVPCFHDYSLIEAGLPPPFTPPIVLDSRPPRLFPFRVEWCREWFWTVQMCLLKERFDLIIDPPPVLGGVVTKV